MDELSYDPKTGNFWWTVPKQGRQMMKPAGSINSEGYRCIMYQGKKVQAGRLAWKLMTGEWPKGEIDHWNRKRDDDRWENLRDVPRKVNAWNTAAHKDKSTDLPRGIELRPDGYRVRMQVAGKRKELCGISSYETVFKILCLWERERDLDMDA